MYKNSCRNLAEALLHCLPWGHRPGLPNSPLHRSFCLKASGSRHWLNWTRCGFVPVKEEVTMAGPDVGFPGVGILRLGTVQAQKEWGCSPAPRPTGQGEDRLH